MVHKKFAKGYMKVVLENFEIDLNISLKEKPFFF